MKESMMDSNNKLSLSWEAYEKSICRGLGLLQQQGEFVDMTLAAEGHHVKVHQMVMSLVSPFIKDLISTANCPHPVIFLNRVSYNTLQSLLEYAYTGEVLVDPDGLINFLEACKDLHIKGLQDITIQGDGKDLLHVIGLKTAEKDDPLEFSATSQVAPSRSGIKRRRMANAGERVEYIHPHIEALHDEQVDETNVEEYENEILYEETLDDDCDETCDDNESQDMKQEDITEDDKFSYDSGDECEEIESYKAGSRWIRRGEYFYVVQRTKGRTAYLRCGSDKCPAQWKLHNEKGAGPVVHAHNHLPTPWVPNRNLMFQALKRRTTTESLPVHVIYEQEACRYSDAAPHLPFESVAPSMRKWRRTTKEELTRGIQSMG